MTTSEALDQISRALGVFAFQTQSENFAGLFSRNRLAEDLLLPLFRLAFDAPDLRNANSDNPNYPAVDLLSARQGIAIQVTTERKAAKISSTLASFTQDPRHKTCRRLVFFLLQDRVPRYSAQNVTSWKRPRRGSSLRFDPARDILAVTKLLPLIQDLPHRTIVGVAELFAESILGDRFVDVSAAIRRQAARQLDLETRTTKYIPDVFVETRATKSRARLFCHPAFFLGKTVSTLSQINLKGLNRVLSRAGLAVLAQPTLPSPESLRDLPDSRRAADNLAAQLADLSARLLPHEKLDYGAPAPRTVPRSKKPYYDANKYHIQMGASGMRFSLQGLCDELTSSSAALFILTGRAGQGKTNFVCDLIENVLWKHDVPCAYLSGRRISNFSEGDVGEIVTRLIFDNAVGSFRDAARRLSDHAAKSKKPFVLVIDGLNEHHKLTEFSAQLEAFVDAFLEYPNLKLLMTCRSEYFQQRFGQLTAGSAKNRTVLLEANELRLEDEAYEDMQAAYFRYFGVDGTKVSENVQRMLRQDMLLLRFFCEAYGAKGKDADYRQPWIRSVYRDEIFRIYLKRKLGTADAFLQRVTGHPNPAGQPQELLQVLEHVLRHMLKMGRFADVPMNAVPASLRNALFVLLDEDLILRRDAPSDGGVFAELADTINFTFDEFRDYLLAEFLVDRVYQEAPADFERILRDSTPTESQALEGLKRFLFYASRQPRREAFRQQYESQSWSEEVYDDEIFNVDAAYLRESDVERVRAALEAGGERARGFARGLVVRWHPIEAGILNLDLLLAVATDATDTFFDDVILPTFRSGYHNTGHSVRAFSAFMSSKVLPKVNPSAASVEEPLLRLAILLLPIDADTELNSPTGQVMRALIEDHNDYAVHLLSDSLLWAVTRHHACVWRLLASAQGVQGEELVHLARQALAQDATVATATSREARRFLEKQMRLQ